MNFSIVFLNVPKNILKNEGKKEEEDIQ